MTSVAVINQTKNVKDGIALLAENNFTENSASRSLAIEWLHFARRDLETAELMIDAEHHEGLAGFELQQGIEKSFKAVLAFYNGKITSSHDLNELRVSIRPYLCIEDYLLVELLEVATEYHRYVQYPQMPGAVPKRKELLEVIELAHLLFEDVIRVLGIDVKEIYDDFGGC